MKAAWKILVAMAGAAAVGVPVGAMAAADSLQVDRFVEDGYNRHSVTPNPPSTDEEFLRRLYLDLAGRIPTFDEAKRFFDDTAPNKRVKVIDELLESESYVYNTFNWWADILRVKSDVQGGQAYKQWLLNGIRENLPYDVMVRQLVNPFSTDSKKRHAFAWENGAVGYYLRDDGMPLDNMSNTVQIFLGTRLVCAQCHNHPFDKWKQMDYYKMAAFTYGIDTRIRPEDIGLDELTGGDDGRRRRSRSDNNEYVRDAMQDVLQPLQYGVRETGRQVQLPHDYKYRDGKPYEEVRSGTMFGDRTKSNLEAYAEWLTSTDNPRFTTVIVNRLWKRVMGWGLIEPVDDMRDDTEASNPALLTFLEREIQRKNYDTKEFLRMLLNTRTYQRQACGDDIPEDTHYYFPGPVLRRMTAEQMWDSFMTVAVPDIDERTMSALAYPREEQYQREAEKLLSLKSKELVDLIRNVAGEYQKFDEARKPLQAAMTKARSGGDGGQARDLQKQIEELSKVRDEAVARLKSEAFAGGGDDSKLAMMSMTKKEDEPAEEAPAMTAMNDARWQGFDGGYIRAVALESPAPASHFLRQFGQSDRETIENATKNASVDQALTLLNSPIFEQVFNDKSPVMKALAAASTPEEKQDVLFISVLSRLPTDEDRQQIASHVEKYGEAKAYRHIAWALMNTQEFAFLQ